MRRLAPILLVAALAVSACGVVGDGRDTVTIGALYPVSGRQGPGGVDEERGARLAVELANHDKTLPGRRIKLELVDVDTGSAAPTAMRALKGDGVDIVLGTYGSTISAPAAATAAREGMLLWETGAVGELTTDDGAVPGQSFFRIAPQGGHLGQAAVEFVRDQLSPLLGASDLRYAVAYVDDAYGRAVGLGAVHEVERGGGVMAGAFPYAARDVEEGGAADLVSRIAAVRPDVLFVSAYLDDGVALRKATIAAHVPLQASIGTSSSYCMPAFAVALGSGAVGLFASDKPDGAQVKPDALTDEGRRTLDWARTHFRDRYHEEMSAAALSGFANAWALVGHVLPASPTLAPADVAATALRLKLPAGTLANGAGLDLASPGQPDAGENRAAVSVIWQWVDARTQAVVWPPAFATRPLVAIPIEV
ncbi:MAG: branched-chain amino acid transport system substrate-binding protein [Actinomycetota bacterium]|jgi:branched-chain amino acid transport system substrate-binding protein|nr:branched-chain amino acid transport system substrate-binding protein [Actinomycetota bacterium]